MQIVKSQKKYYSSLQKVHQKMYLNPELNQIKIIDKKNLRNSKIKYEHKILQVIVLKQAIQQTTQEISFHNDKNFIQESQQIQQIQLAKIISKCLEKKRPLFLMRQSSHLHQCSNQSQKLSQSSFQTNIGHSVNIGNLGKGKHKKTFKQQKQRNKKQRLQKSKDINKQRKYMKLVKQVNYLRKQNEQMKQNMIETVIQYEDTIFNLKKQIEELKGLNSQLTKKSKNSKKIKKEDFKQRFQNFKRETIFKK